MAERFPKSYCGWTDDEIAARCTEFGVRVNRVECDVLKAIMDGHLRTADVVIATGLTRGQVVHAAGVLREQGLAEVEPDA